ncbi:MAG: Gfo/Idh/MocA family oxidoreductase [Spirochaetales bacterium]|nr:Gfo/Idh/MocA family oxidoreductase [Spirochaetales bacterium]
MKPKFGIVGCGNISRFHFNGLEKTGAEIVHIADINEEAAKPWVEKFGAKISTDYNNLIKDPEVTVVSILTGSKFHKDIALKAIRAGKDIVCEKTMMDNAFEAEEVVKAVSNSHTLFFTAFMKRFFPASIKAKEFIPALGRIFSAQVRTYQPWGNFYETDDVGSFGFVLGTYGGAVTKCAGSHMLDMMMFLLGRPTSLYANMDYIPGTRFDRKATALFEYMGGLVVSFEAATHPLKKIGYEKNSWDEFIQIHGVNGRIDLYTVMWDHPENNAALLVYYNNEDKTSTEYRFDAVNPFDVEMNYIVDCLSNRKQGDPTVIDGFNTDVIIETMTQSAQDKVSVSIDWKGL